MDQKNTIVKCKAHPNCLFNHNGTCDNYVINIGADGKCEGYIETAKVDNFEISEIEEIIIYKPGSKEPLLTLKEPKRGQRAKCNVYDDMMNIEDKHLSEAVTVKMKIAELNKPNKNKSSIRDVVPECDLPVCDWSCKHALRSGPSFNPDLWCDKMKAKPAVGLFCSDYEEEK